MPPSPRRCGFWLRHPPSNPKVQGKDGATANGCLSVSCFIGEKTIDELLSEGGMVDALLTTLTRPCPKPNVYHMTCGIFTTLCRTHHSTNVARQIVADGGLDRVLDLMKELLDDDFVQLKFLRFICTLSQVVDTKEDTSRCLDLLPAVMDRHATSSVIYYNAYLVIAAQFGPGCRWSKDIARSICSSLANGIVLHEGKNQKAHDKEKRTPRRWSIRERSSCSIALSRRDTPKRRRARSIRRHL